MADFSASTWNEQDAANTASAPNGFPTGQSPSTLGPTWRNMAGANTRFYRRINGWYATTGTATALILTFEQPVTSYTRGERIMFVPNATNTGAMTLNINTVGAKSILRGDGSALVAGDVASGVFTEVIYDGSAFRLNNGIATNATFAGTVKANIVEAGSVNTTTINSATTNATTLSAANGTITQNLQINGNLGVGGVLPTGTFNNGKALAIGDNDSGIRSGGDGILEFWTNNSLAITVDGTGGVSLAKSLYVNSGTVSAANFAVSNAYGLRNTYGNYGTIWYQDANDGYYLITNSGNQNGGFNSLRPLRINLASGDIAFGTNIQVGGTANVSGNAYIGGELGVGAARYYNDGNIAFKSGMTAHGATLYDAFNACVKNNGMTASINITGRSAGTKLVDGRDVNWNWSGQGGQPSWLWGSSGDGTQQYVYNPSNFSVNYANSANYAETTNLTRIGNMVIGSVGTYSMLSSLGAGTANPGDTRLGSTLRWAAASGTNNTGSPDGTWRCAGQIYGPGTSTGSTTNWLRIS